MEAQCAPVLDALRRSLTARDGPLLVAAAIGGTYNVTGPRRVNGHAINKLAATAGVQWSIDFVPTAGPGTRPTIKLSPAAEWAPPLAAVSGSGIDGVSAWVAAQPGLRTAQTFLDGRASGCVTVAVFEADGAISSTSAAEALRIPGVVNLFMFADRFEVWLARPSTAKGSLQHLAAASRVGTRLAPKPRRAGKTPQAPRRRKRVRHG